MWRDSDDTGRTSSWSSQSPIQRGWLCGLHEDAAHTGGCLGSQSPIQRGWLCGTGAWPSTLTGSARKSQSPIQRGWLCGGAHIEGCNEPPQVSIPYPAGMALWQACSNLQSMELIRLNPLSSGDGFVAFLTVRTVFLTGYRSLNPLSSGDGFVACGLHAHRDAHDPVSIPYPAGMALWRVPTEGLYRPAVRSQSPIQRGWLCGFIRGHG